MKIRLIVSSVLALVTLAPSLQTAAAAPAPPQEPGGSAVAVDGAHDVQALRDRLGRDDPGAATQSTADASALANIRTVTDATGDSIWYRGDLTNAGVNAAVDATVFAVSVALYESPYSTNWQFGATGIFWDVDIDNNGSADGYVYLLNVNGSLRAGLADNGNNTVCTGTGLYSAASSSYGVGFLASCFAPLSSFQWRSAMLFEDYFLASQSFDQAPNGGAWGPVVSNDAWTAPAPPPPTTGTYGPGGYAPMTPGRLVDTRLDGATADGQYARLGLRAGGTVTQVEVAGRGGVADDAASAVLNVTVTDAQGSGYVTVFPCGSAQPNASNVNYAVGTTTANLVAAALATDGTICIYTYAAANLIVDVNGTYASTAGFHATSPARLMDTRPDGATTDGQSARIGVRSGGTVTELQVTGRGGVPGNASAVMLNVTVTDAAGGGYVTVFPCGSSQPNASNVNYTAGATVPNAVLAKLGTGGRVCIFTYAATNLIVDVNGNYDGSAGFGSLVPARLMDTRADGATYDGQYQRMLKRVGGTVTEMVVTGRGGVPANATAVMLNVTATDPTGAGYLTIFPCGESQPNASNVNYSAGSTVPNAVVAKVGSGGRICVFTYADTNVIIDVNGFHA